MTSLGGAIALFPYVLAYLNTLYSVRTAVYLVAPDALIVGSVLLLAVVILSVVCASFEKGFDADIFKKNIDASEQEDVSNIRDYNERIDTDDNERIRRLFDNAYDADSEDKK